MIGVLLSGCFGALRPSYIRSLQNIILLLSFTEIQLPLDNKVTRRSNVYKLQQARSHGRITCYPVGGERTEQWVFYYVLHVLSTMSLENTAARQSEPGRMRSTLGKLLQ